LWIGPYIVEKITGPLSYVVVDPKDATNRYRVHRQHLKLKYQCDEAPEQSSWPGAMPRNSDKMMLPKAKGVSFGTSSSFNDASKPGPRAKKPTISEGASVVTGDHEMPYTKQQRI
jgi:hypothetical protein